MRAIGNIEKELAAHLISNPEMGVALASTNDSEILFENAAFSMLICGDSSVSSRIPTFDLDRMNRSLARKGVYIIEHEVKVNNRSKIIQLSFSPYQQDQVLVTTTDYTKEKENEYLLESYIKIAEDHKQELEASLQLIRAQKEELQLSNAALEKERNSVELRMLQAVINPHFISNSLASIQGFIVDKNTDEAVNYLAHFGRLMRLSFEQSYFDFIAMDEILELLTTYVAIEQMRMDHPWEFDLKVDESINTSNSKIPPLLIQPFIENAIWHGINRKKSGGKISVEIKLINELTIQCIVSDNGFGRNHKQGLVKISKENKNMGLHSLNVTNKRLEILWEDHHQKKSVVYTDLVDSNGKPCGTEVSLFIPISF